MASVPKPTRWAGRGSSRLALHLADAEQAHRTTPRGARRFVEDMRAFFKETNQIKQDEIAARSSMPSDSTTRQASAYRHQEMFVQMKDNA